MHDIIKERINDSINIKRRLLENSSLLNVVEKVVEEIVTAIKSGHKLVICGNGGSASDSLHFAGEIVGRFQKERMAWPAVVLNADVTTMTAIANDYGFDEVFSRQAECQVNLGDVFIGISTSGNSENIYRAIEVARKKGGKTVALLGFDGGRIGKRIDYPIIVPCRITARVQECHILLIHIICEMVEMKFE
jgi:D-sedoheptulose 7-phosphate isomerase